jgi:hypothetical protein
MHLAGERISGHLAGLDRAEFERFEDAWARWRAKGPAMPRTIDIICSPGARG